MKKSLTIFSMILVGMGVLLGKSPNLSIKMGAPVSTTQVLFGSFTLKGKGIIPTVSLGYYSLSSTREYSDDYDSEKFDITVRLFIPKVGSRVITPKVDNLRGYLTLEVFTLIPIVTSEKMTDKEKDDLKDVLDLLGLTVGWGAEYFFSPRFSVGGETSLNYILHDREYKSEYSDYSSKTRTILGAILTQLTFNFYFE